MVRHVRMPRASCADRSCGKTSQRVFGVLLLVVLLWCAVVVLCCCLCRRRPDVCVLSLAGVSWMWPWPGEGKAVQWWTDRSRGRRCALVLLHRSARVVRSVARQHGDLHAACDAPSIIAASQLARAALSIAPQRCSGARAKHRCSCGIVVNACEVAVFAARRRAMFPNPPPRRHSGLLRARRGDTHGAHSAALFLARHGLVGGSLKTDGRRRWGGLVVKSGRSFGHSRAGGPQRGLTCGRAAAVAGPRDGGRAGWSAGARSRWAAVGSRGCGCIRRV